MNPIGYFNNIAGDNFNIPYYAITVTPDTKEVMVLVESVNTMVWITIKEEWIIK